MKKSQLLSFRSLAIIVATLLFSLTLNAQGTGGGDPEVPIYANLAAMKAEGDIAGETYGIVQSEFVITHVYGGTALNFYMQDESMALQLTGDFFALGGAPIVGDRYQGATLIYGDDMWYIVDAGTTRNEAATPEVVTLAALNAQKATYASRLIRVEGLTFNQTGEFASGVSYSVTAGAETSNVSFFPGNDIYTTAIPTGTVALTGIYRSTTSAISPRQLSDIEVADVPQPEGFANLAEFWAASAEGTAEGVVASEFVVTFVSRTYVFIEDESMGMVVDPSFFMAARISPVVGDRFQGATISANEWGEMLLTDVGTTSNATPDPLVVTLSQLALAANPEQYLNRLLRVEGVTFNQTGNFTSGTRYSVSLDSTTANVAFFPANDIYGTAVPATPVTLTGIYYAERGIAIYPRELADIVASEVIDPDPDPEYTELLLNAGFEISEEVNFLGTIKTEFEDWTISVAPDKVTAEKTDKVEGMQSLKINAPTQAANSISQEVFDIFNLPTENATYQMRVKYKVLQGVAGGDVKIESFWTHRADGRLDHDNEVLVTDFMTSDDWNEVNITTTCPVGANHFTFQVLVATGAVVLFDDFSFHRLVSTAPEVNVKYTTTHVTADINTDVTYPAIVVEQHNLTLPITVEITGANAEFFTSSVETIAAADGESQIIITYHPTEVGTHKALVNIEPGDKGPSMSSLYQSVSLTAVCTDPAQAPTITLTPDTLEAFSAAVGSTQVQTLVLSSTSCIQPINAVMTHFEGEGFVVNGSLFPQNMDANIEITFSPLFEGEYYSQVTFSTEGAEDVVLTLKGIAKAGEVEPEDWSRVFNFDWDNPQPFLNETFEDVVATSNKTLHIEKWQNVVIAGNRPWWGFIHTESPESSIPLERTAKATSYSYQMPSDGSRAEMWMVTPMLDFKNAESRIFTFRVMGDFMFEGHDTKLSVYLIDSVAGELRPFFGEIEGLNIPTLPDQNGEWNELHVNLEGQDITDAFCIGFKYDGIIGEENAVVYYIDDVSWGRTDLAAITTDSTEVRMVATQSKVAKTTIEVTTSNLAEPVTITCGGANPSNFEVVSLANNNNVVPAEGGAFELRFQSDNLGVHEAYLKLSSRGAADVYIPLSVLCNVNSSTDDIASDAVLCWTKGGEVNVVAEGLVAVEVYDISGRVVATLSATSDTMNFRLPVPGVYVVKATTQSGVAVRKVTI